MKFYDVDQAMQEVKALGEEAPRAAKNAVEDCAQEAYGLDIEEFKTHRGIVDAMEALEQYAQFS